MSIERKIKRRNGEMFYKTIKNYHNGIFEIPNISEIVFFAGDTKEDAENIIPYLLNLLTVDEEKTTIIENPFELLKKAGYDAFVADSLEKQNSIKHYYAFGEELCTFRDNSRFKNYYVIHCVHENAKNLKRKDFKKPDRQDAYGTSVISIQIAKKGGFISIKNRYNHKVKNCDNTFGSNPDNIVKGLSEALKKHFKVDFKNTKNIHDDFVIVDDKIIKKLYELEGVVFGKDLYVKNGKIKYVDKGRGEILIESFIYDDRKKMMTEIIKDLDSFANDFNRYYGNDKKLHIKGNDIFYGEERIIKCV